MSSTDLYYFNDLITFRHSTQCRLPSLRELDQALARLGRTMHSFGHECGVTHLRQHSKSCEKRRCLEMFSKSDMGYAGRQS